MKIRRLTAMAAVVLHLFCCKVKANWQEGSSEQEEKEEQTVSVGGFLSLQTGVFVPLVSDQFRPLQDRAFTPTDSPTGRVSCDPVKNPTSGCIPQDHGKRPGSFSMGRGTLTIEGDWFAYPEVTLHAILRGVRSMQLSADEEGQMPIAHLDPLTRREAIMNWVHERYHTEFEVRELYVDTYPYDWLSFRLGRQQVAWGELGQYRLLDVINPSDNSWHFSALESFEDTRIPLWMAKGLIDISSIEHSLEWVWAPLFFDRPEDTVSVPLSFPGAWGLPYSNTPGSFVRQKVFNYPGGESNDMRAGFRWKGAYDSMTYSLVYYYTHQLSPPIPTYLLIATDTAEDSPTEVEKYNIEFPRQHIVGFSLDYAFDSPIGLLARVESAVELNRTFPKITTAITPDPDNPIRFNMSPVEKPTVSYAVQLSRPTMIRFLNPTQNFYLMAQFMHTLIPSLTTEEKQQLVEIPGYNQMFIKEHSFSFVVAIRTSYWHELFTPAVIGAFIPPDNGYYTLRFKFNLGDNWRLTVAATDFFGTDPYKSVGLFRDRDEVNLNLLCQF